MTATSSVGTVTFNATVLESTTTTSLDADPNPPSPSGTNVTLTATVESDDGIRRGTWNSATMALPSEPMTSTGMVRR